MPSISDDERRWRAESDAHTLADANVIRSDKSRLSAAQDAARRMAEEQSERAKAMKQVAGQKDKTMSSNSSTKSTDNSTPKQVPFNVFKRIP